ncbi:MAG: hypothetical protein AAFV43_11680 [Planctomycetota bacterium]
MTRRILGVVAALAIGTQANAGKVEIQLVGVDIEYDATTGEISQLGAAPDALAAMFFFNDDSEVGKLLTPTDDISFKLTIPNVFGIDPNGETINVANEPGSLELLIPDSALLLTLSTAEVVYQPVFGGIGDLRFTFVGSVGSVVSQALPFDLKIGDPVTVSLSTQATLLTSTSSEITRLEARGTGELSAEFAVDPNNNIPEPRMLAMIAAIGAVAAVTSGRPTRR